MCSSDLWFYDTSAQNQPMWMSDLTCADTDKRLDECKMYDGTNADNRAASFDVWLDVRASPVVGGHGDNCASDDYFGAYVECDPASQMSWAERFSQANNYNLPYPSSAIRGARGYGGPYHEMTPEQKIAYNDALDDATIKKLLETHGLGAKIGRAHV